MTYPYPLYGAWQKIVRAEKHLQALKAEVREFLDSDPYRFVPQLDKERSRYVFYVDGVGEPPPNIGTCLGDYVHNLRSALDHLAWQLALLKWGGPIPKKVWNEISYPIAEDIAGFRSRSVLAHLRDEHITLLKGFQTKKRVSENPLVLLNALWNTDKHRLVHTTLVTVADQTPNFVTNRDAELGDIWYAKGKQLETGAKFACVTFVPLGPDPKVDVDNVQVDLVFGECPARALNALRDVTTDIVNACHEAFFGS